MMLSGKASCRCTPCAPRNTYLGSISVSFHGLSGGISARSTLKTKALSMARSRILPLLCLVALLVLPRTFVSPPRAGAAALAAGAALPQAAQALEGLDLDSSSVNVSATIEALMLGIVLGTVPITASSPHF